jgi:hypothetical protein
MMTRRQPKAKPPEGKRVSREEFPALTAFFSGYLHEDFVPEHGTSTQAARAFHGDASADERRAVNMELIQLLARTEGWTLGDLRRALADLGAAWLPSSRAEVEALLSEPPDQD